MTVEIFHKNLGDEKLRNIEEVTNDTLKRCCRFFDVQIDDDANFRIFMLENRDQLTEVLKKVHDFDPPRTWTGLTVNNNHPQYKELSEFSASDVFFFLNENNWWLLEKPFSDNYIKYHISHEFTHCIQFLKFYQPVIEGLSPKLQLPVFEGSADFIACEKTYDGLEKNSICESRFKQGIDKVKSENLSLYTIYYGYHDQTSDNPYKTGVVVSKFLNDQHPKMIVKQFHCTGQGDYKCHHDLQSKIWEISSGKEFANWVDKQYHSTDSMIL
ncbi:collagenase [Candidatus Wolbachia massiliensis]|uniref:Collagenase n=1 Tax=Candidatus Wolbachia massiliensis TaxID=1845000 RepID=A0A7M3U2L2_9RICK|nr:collagenase [Candidatus Wolbachia massiliensis]QOD38647.1 collagenase [Candidatus Wolbachia massiliensis]